MSRLPEPLLVVPQVTPPLDPGFRPAVLVRRHVAGTAGATTLRVALEQADGSVSHAAHPLLAESPNAAAANAVLAERLVKFLLWARGGWRIHVAGRPDLAAHLRRHYAETAVGQFDDEIIGRRIYGHRLEVMDAAELPPARAVTAPLGRHWRGCRIGFDLGGSDRKVAAVVDGNPVFTEETVWDPIKQADPQYHFDGIMDSLRRAAVHLPRVEAIGGSAAGVYVNNEPRVASLFRAVPPELFASRVKGLFHELKAAWGGVPFEVANDGEVTALAGAMALGANAVLGIAMGTSTAAGYVTRDGGITSWLNELAFAPVDLRPDGPADEWSGDRGCGVQFFSQQGVARLITAAGIAVETGLPLPEQLKHVQSLMAAGDGRARRIYETIGVCFGYAVAHYADFYDFDHVLVLGRVLTGEGGAVILDRAGEVLRVEFPELAARVRFHTPDETSKRHGQAVAAASLPPA
ncbi:MAG: ROK family protein [Limisphaerales bacterium]